MEDEGRLFATFEKAPEFLENLSIFLAVDLRYEPTPSENQTEIELHQKLLRILDDYQEQIYLLDPFLERMVTPIVEVFKAHAAQYTSALKSGKDAPYSPTRITRITLLLYMFVKCRGRKVIVNFFPHQVADLSVALDYLSALDGPAERISQWPLQYLVLLWLSLICMIPFDLSKFDESGLPSTSQRLDKIATRYLGQAGLAREAAAVFLSRLYTRKDTAALFADFLKHSTTLLEESTEVSKSIGVLHVLCEITKSGVTEQVTRHVTSIRYALEVIEAKRRLLNNTLVRKLKIKLEGRLAVAVIPFRRQIARKMRPLQSDLDVRSEDEGQHDNSQDIDVSEEVEHSISTLFEGLQDKDTTVRYSASKHLARISARIPLSYTEQVLDNVLQLFTIHSAPDERIENLPSVAEATWHGACLACAEMSRRALIPTQYLTQLLEWLKKALLFDIRQGAHSVGSSVRDAASYVLWALARSHDAEALKPYSLSLAQRVVAVSLFDREVHIRRAASAAFQENVGRLNVFPHGIDVLRKTDFFAVGVRKNAFLVAAPQVAEHSEYRMALIDHIISRTIIHWDPAMRLLGAQSLRIICELDLGDLGTRAESRLTLLLQSVDANNVHGSILALSELAYSYQTKGGMEEERLRIFKTLATLPASMIQKYSREQILSATCLLISNSISHSAIRLDPSSTSRWRTIVEQGLRHRDTQVQEAAACAMQAFSRLVDCSGDVKRYVNDFARGPPTVQQSVARMLGSLAYAQHDHAVREALNCLLEGVNPSSTKFSSNVEARRNCYFAMSEVVCNLDPKIPEALTCEIVHRVLRACIMGLEDYTTDERGDVGSWIRMACIRGICSMVEVLFNLAPALEHHGTLNAWMPAETYQEMIGGILKQGVERLDNVRRQAGESFLNLLRLDPPKLDGSCRWEVRGGPLMRQLLLSDKEDVGWNEGQWLFPKAVRFLEVSEYRRYVLRGLVLSIGSRTDSTQRPVATSFAEFTGSLPVSSGVMGKLDLLTIVEELSFLARKDILSNHIVIPVLQTFDLMLDAGNMEKLADIELGVNALNTLVDISTRNVARLKNIQRILASMKLVNGVLAVPCMAGKGTAILPHYLLHEFPKVRTDTAEHLYLVMQSKDLGFETEQVEEILLETDWSISVDELRPKVEKMISLFGRDMGV